MSAKQAKKTEAKKDGKQEEQAGPQFGIQRIYMKDSSFEAPGVPDIFRKDWKPEMSMDLHTESKLLEDEGVYEVILQVTVTVKTNDEVAFLAEVKQAGIFTVKDFETEQRGHILGSICPGILFPYVRECVSDLVTKGSFPQLVLAPINFDAIYMQQKEKAKEKAH